MLHDNDGDGSAGGERTETPRAKPRPLITPESFNGTGSFNDWVDHFEGVAAMNKWDDAAKLLWMRAQTAYGRLPEMSKASYDSLRKALKERFEPDSKKELYLSEFSTQKHKTGDGWAEYADELRVLADQAFPDLDEIARERLALNQYLSQLDNPQVAFNMKQKWPDKLVDAVSTTLEMESYLVPRSHKVASVDMQESQVVAAVQSKQDVISMMENMLQTMMERLDRLEKQVPHINPPLSTPVNHPNTIICCKCGQAGHLACGYANSRRVNRPASEDTVATVPQNCNCVFSGTMNGTPTKYLLDTGAAVTLLHKDKWDGLPSASTPLKSWTGRPLVGVAGNPLEVWGTAFVDVEIAGEHFHTQVVVASALTTEAILGEDFLRDNQCALEIGQRQLRFGSRGVAITMNDVSVIVQA